MELLFVACASACVFLLVSIHDFASGVRDLGRASLEIARAYRKSVDKDNGHN